MLSGSLMWPTPTDMDAADRSVDGSLTSSTRIPLASSRPRYKRSSPSDFVMFSNLEDAREMKRCPERLARCEVTYLFGPPATDSSCVLLCIIRICGCSCTRSRRRRGLIKDFARQKMEEFLEEERNGETEIVLKNALGTRSQGVTWPPHTSADCDALHQST